MSRMGCSVGTDDCPIVGIIVGVVVGGNVVFCKISKSSTINALSAAKYRPI